MSLLIRLSMIKGFWSVFESVIEKVLIGGYDEDGNLDPYKITFSYVVFSVFIE